ncbi:bola protein [Chaetomium sp. MPI-SDFR-AT-0129]|nr:bola protein [Chaetomium sp. MPI-SDFR-AT-0129]
MICRTCLRAQRALPTRLLQTTTQTQSLSTAARRLQLPSSRRLLPQLQHPKLFSTSPSSSYSSSAASTTQPTTPTSSSSTTPSSSNTPSPLEKPTYLSEGESQVWDLLHAEFAPIQLEVQDISGGCGSMYGIEVCSEKFRGLNILKQQRLVNAALGGLMKEWHGVQLKTRVP